MKVYLLWYDGMNQSRIYGIFSSREKAEVKQWALINTRLGRFNEKFLYAEDFRIEEVGIDE